MSERENYLGYKDNLITKINYSSKAKGVFGLLMFGIPAIYLCLLERGPEKDRVPMFMRGHLFDAMAAPSAASFNKIFMGDNFGKNFIAAIGAPVLVELYQGIHLANGTFDPADLIAYGIGAVGWAAFERTAKAVHDSGLTLPIYRVLHIHHKKFG